METEHPTVYAVNGSVPYEGSLVGAFEGPRGRVLVVQSPKYGVLQHSLMDVFDTDTEALRRAKVIVGEAIEANQQRLDHLNREGVNAVIR